MCSVIVSVALCASSAISHSPITYQFGPHRHLSAAAQPFDPLDPPSDSAPPQGCHVTRAAYLVRHAAIYANDYDYDSYIEPFV
jgi:acid phosphatase